MRSILALALFGAAIAASFAVDPWPRDVEGPAVEPPAPRSGPTLDEPGWVRISVVESRTGTPVPNAALAILRKEGPHHGFVSFNSADTVEMPAGSDGIAWFGPIDAGILRVTATHDRFVEVVVERFVLPVRSGEPAAEIWIETVPGAPLAGTLRLVGGGRPIGGRVFAEPVLAGRVGLYRRIEADISREGEFRFLALPLGPYRLTWTPRGDDGGPDPVPVGLGRAGKEDHVFRVRLPEEDPWDGRKRVGTPADFVISCIGPDGKPVERYRVEAGPTLYRVPLGRGWSGYVRRGAGVRKARIDHRARLSLTDFGDPFWFRVEPDGTELGSTVVGPFRPGFVIPEICLPKPWTLRGIALDPEGSPVPGARVVIRPVHPCFSSPPGAFRRPTTTDTTGRFEIGGLGREPYRLMVSSGRNLSTVSWMPVTPADVPIEVRLRETGVTIQVVDEAGVPVPGATVYTRESSSSYVGISFPVAVTDLEGRADLSAFAPEVPSPLMVIDDRSGRGLAPFRDLEWKPRDARVVLRETSWIHGVVLDEHARPYPNATVWALRGAETIRCAGTHTHGGFRMRLPDGPGVTLRAVRWSEDPLRVGGPHVRVTAGTEFATLRLERGVRLDVRVTNWPRGIEGRIQLRDPDDNVLRGRLVSRGRGLFRFHGVLRKPEFTLEVVAEEGPLALSLPGIRAGPDRIEVTLVPGAGITGRIILPAGARPYSVVAHRGGLRRTLAPEPDGRFRLEGLCTGAWTIEACAVGPHHVHTGRTEAQAGSRVEIVVE